MFKTLGHKSWKVIRAISNCVEADLKRLMRRQKQRVSSNAQKREPIQNLPRQVPGARMQKLEAPLPKVRREILWNAAQCVSKILKMLFNAAGVAQDEKCVKK